MKTDRRWWNDGRYSAACADEDDARGHVNGQPEWLLRNTIRAVTESGLEIRVKLITRFPMHVGVAYL